MIRVHNINVEKVSNLCILNLLQQRTGSSYTTHPIHRQHQHKFQNKNSIPHTLKFSPVPLTATGQSILILYMDYSQLSFRYPHQLSTTSLSLIPNFYRFQTSIDSQIPTYRNTNNMYQLDHFTFKASKLNPSTKKVIIPIKLITFSIQLHTIYHA